MLGDAQLHPFREEISIGKASQVMPHSDASRRFNKEIGKLADNNVAGLGVN